MVDDVIHNTSDWPLTMIISLRIINTLSHLSQMMPNKPLDGQVSLWLTAAGSDWATPPQG